MKKVALVEDSPDNRLLFRLILESHYDVVEYEDGVTAWAGLQRSKPDLVLLDISLPDIDGLAVLGRIRANAALKDLPVIALTAHAQAGDREQLLAAGFNEYVTKPVLDETVLLTSIDLCMKRGEA